MARLHANKAGDQCNIVDQRANESNDKAKGWRSGGEILIGVRGVMQWQVVCCRWQLEASGQSVLETKLVLPTPANDAR